MRRELQTKVQLQGFTLLEMLVVTAILMLIISASFGALRLGNRSFEAGISRANQTEHFRATAVRGSRNEDNRRLPRLRSGDVEGLSAGP